MNFQITGKILFLARVILLKLGILALLAKTNKMAILDFRFRSKNKDEEYI